MKAAVASFMNTVATKTLSEIALSPALTRKNAIS